MNDDNDVTSQEPIHPPATLALTGDVRETDRRDEIISLLESAWERALADLEQFDRAA